MRRFLENWGLVIAAVLCGLMLITLALLTGCSFVEGARDAALEEVAGTPSPGKPSGTSSADGLLYTLGGALVGVAARHFLGRKKEA